MHWNGKSNLTGEYLVKGVLAEKVQVEKYAPNEYINPDFVKNCNILPNYDRISGSWIMYPVLIVEFHLPSAICICSTRIPTGIKTDGKERVTTQRKWFSLGIVSGAAEFLGMNKNRVEMESDPFNQQFKVITSDDELPSIFSRHNSWNILLLQMRRSTATRRLNLRTAKSRWH